MSDRESPVVEPTGTASVLQDLEHLVRASYPLIYVVSSEERRVEGYLAALAKRRKRAFYRWSITEGFRKADGTAHQDVRDPIAALDTLLKQEEPALFVLRDFHPFLKDLTVNRKVRDLNRALRTSGTTAIVLSPVGATAPELAKEMVVVDFPLPDAAELAATVQRLVRESGGRVQLEDGDEEALVDALAGLTDEEAENVLAKSLVAARRFDLSLIIGEKEQVIRQSKALEYFHPREGLDDVGGLPALKDWLRKRRRAFSRKAREFGLPTPKGLLLIGVPGCGKSLTAKAVASAWGMPLLRLDMGAVFGSFVGTSEENIRQATRTAEAVAPCVLWLDELEKGLSGSKSSGQTDGGTTSRVFGTFISWLQEKRSPVFVVATANDVTALPPELLRKGRFDEIFFVDLPDRQAREDIYSIHIARRDRDLETFDLPELAAASEAFSGSEIEQIVVSGLYDAFERGGDLEQRDLLAAIAATVPLSTTMHEDIEAMRHWADSRARMASGPGTPAGAATPPSGDRLLDFED